MKRIFLRNQKCKRPSAKSPLAAVRHSRNGSEVPDAHDRKPAQKKREPIHRRVILSVSDDIDFDKHLRMAALQRGQIVIRVECVESALRLIQTECAGVILLDLDFAGKNAWELAGRLLQEGKCPPVILLTGQGEQLNLRMAVMAGSIIAKSDDIKGILNRVGELMEAPPEEQARRSLVQRGMIRGTRAAVEPAPLIPAQRFWGINE